MANTLKVGELEVAVPEGALDIWAEVGGVAVEGDDDDALPTTRPVADEMYSEEEGQPEAEKAPAAEEEAEELPWHVVKLKPGQDRVDLLEALSQVKRTTKHRGKEVEIPLSEMLTDDAVQSRYRTGEAERRAAERERQLQDVAKALETSDFDTLAKLTGKSLDLDRVVDAEILRRIEEAELTPQERALRQKERELEAKEARLQAQERQKLDREADQELATRARYADNILKSLKIPENPITAQTLMAYLEDGAEEGMSYDAAAALWYKDLKATFQTTAKARSEDELAEELGEDVVRKMAKHHATKVQSKTQALRGEPVAQAKSGDGEKPASGTALSAAKKAALRAAGFPKAIWDR
jgi:hypothetical protein